MLEGIEGVVDVVGVQRGNPETTWDFDPRGARPARASPSTQVSEQLSDAWLGDVKTDLRLPDRTIPVRVRYPDAYRLDPAADGGDAVRADGRLGRRSRARWRSRRRPRARSSCSARTCGRWRSSPARLEDRDLGSAVAEIQPKLRGAEAAGRLHARRSAASTRRSGSRSGSC